jgi:hypothetical protein
MELLTYLLWTTIVNIPKQYYKEDSPDRYKREMGHELLRLASNT